MASAEALEQQLRNNRLNALPELVASLCDSSSAPELVRACAALESFFTEQLASGHLWRADSAPSRSLSYLRAWCATGGRFTPPVSVPADAMYPSICVIFPMLP